MNKNTRTLLITIISFVVVIIIALVAYNALKKNAPAVSFKPTLAMEQQAPEPRRPKQQNLLCQRRTRLLILRQRSHKKSPRLLSQ